jgi:hypothetical protein
MKKNQGLSVLTKRKEVEAPKSKKRNFRQFNTSELLSQVVDEAANGSR